MGRNVYAYIPVVSRRALTHLKTVDPILARVIERVGPYRPRMQTEGTHFSAIVRAIMYQQLSGKAAATIHARFLGLYGDREPTPAQILATPDDALRSVGLSRPKARYLKDLAQRVENTGLPIERLHELGDNAVMDALVQVKGIGRWTAHMFLLFRLGRLDVLPELDLGVRKAVQQVYGLRRLPTPEQVQKRGAAWSPYASVATWYLWRSLELPPTVIARPEGPKKSARVATPKRPRKRVRRRIAGHGRPRRAAL
jgi:DNA-3-methyladenine glycosylase II